LGNVYGLVSFSSGEHFDFSYTQPSDKLQDHVLSGAKGNGVDNVAQIWLEAGGDVDGAQSSLEVGDFEATGDELVLELLFSGLAFVELLTGVQGAVVYGGDESVGDSVNGLIDIGVHVEEYFCCSRRYWGKLLLGFARGGREMERWQVLISGYDNSG